MSLTQCAITEDKLTIEEDKGVIYTLFIENPSKIFNVSVLNMRQKIWTYE